LLRAMSSLHPFYFFEVIMRKLTLSITFILAIAATAFGQRDLSGTAQIKLALENLAETRSVLMIAAHPDDERTSLLAYLARGRHVRTGYLSLTRGEGGQNLIGPEQGPLLGVIRTEELLAARKIDGAEQFFTRAIDFGFSKTAEETLRKWGPEAVLSDIVWVIRRFQPDVIVLVFSGTPRDGHGHHQASSILGKQAFVAAADKTRFPEQLKYVDVWKTKRIFQLARRSLGPIRTEDRDAAADKDEQSIQIDTGKFDPVLGYSYNEIAGMSRSMHRSQGQGSAEQRGSGETSLVLVAGTPVQRDLLDGIDETWTNVPGGPAIGDFLSQATQQFDAEHPDRTIPTLLKARSLLASMKGDWVARKLRSLDETVSLCAGLWLDASTGSATAVPGSAVQIKTTALDRSQFPVVLKSVKTSGSPGAPAADPLSDQLPYNRADSKTLTWKVPATQPPSQPYWLKKPRSGDLYTVDDQLLIGLADSPPVLDATFRLQADTAEIELTRPVQYRYVDRVRGELTRPFQVVPAVALEVAESPVIFPNGAAKSVEIEVKANKATAAGTVAPQVPAGWHVEPASRQFSLSRTSDEVSLGYTVTPPAGEERADLIAQAKMPDGRTLSASMNVIAYPHIPEQVVFQPATSTVVRADIKTLAHRVGYIAGAGDEVHQALRQMGCEVTFLDSGFLARGDLSGFDAIVAGVRAYNVRPDLRANQPRLLEYVKQGGTYIVQYNTVGFGDYAKEDGAVAAQMGPYPFEISHDRVTDEHAPVRFPNPQNVLLHSPNQITEKDFEGWVQERGLYFASKWDPHYESLFESHDDAEPPRPGGMLFARYGKGAYFYTGYSWFRELPAGVPGAFRIFANLLSAGKTLRDDKSR
jgi:LmbE family N-acetylglucosaminyl deacetylase